MYTNDNNTMYDNRGYSESDYEVKGYCNCCEEELREGDHVVQLEPGIYLCDDCIFDMRVTL